MPATRLRRNLILLACCQALAMTAMTMIATVIALAGHALAEVKALATLPIALQMVVTTLTTVPASFFMRRYGRRAGFTLGAALGALSALGSAYAIWIGSFALFTVTAAAYGMCQSFALFYRFAATDAVPAEMRGKAVSLVMAGGVVAGFVGPTLAVWSRAAVPAAAFAGSFIAVAGLALIAIVLLQAIRIPPLTPAEKAATQRPLLSILSQPIFLAAAITATIGYSSMVLVMTATPLAMLEHHHDFPSTAFVIQWHVVAMYAPSFITGTLIRRLGLPAVILSGIAALGGTVLVNALGISIWHFWLALVLLGIGWNFMFVGGTTLLAEAHSPAERAKAQALNDFMMFSLVAIASLGSGALQHEAGWAAVNLALVPGLGVAAAVNLWLRRRRLPLPA